MTNRFIRHTFRPAPLTTGLTLACSALHPQAADAATTAKSRHHRPVVHKTVVAAQTPKTPAVSAAGAQTPVTATGTGARSINTGSEVRKTSIASEDVVVRGRGMNVLNEDMGFGRMPQDVLHTPQTVNVVPKLLMEQQNVKSLEEALRNVPGITASVGEGEGGMSGDQFLIRGFQAQNDIYENGLRDFGVYTRDSFDYDHVAVIKGPSSEVFGNGTTGGAINISTKVARLGNSYGGTFSGGSGSYYRGTLDVNQQIGEHTAVRITGMGNENDVVGRDDVYSHRWGIAPSIGFGLGTKTTFTLEYFHQSDNRIPDYGVPVVTKPGATVGKPATEYGLNRNNWYGTTYDQDDSAVDMLTARFKHQMNEHITFFDDLRGGMYSRYFSASQPGCSATCQLDFFTDPSAATVDRRGPLGGPEPYQQNDWSVQNVFSTMANFNTGSIRHQILAGIDIMHVYDRRKNYAYNYNGVNGTQTDTTSLINPSASEPGLVLGKLGQYQYDLVNIKNGVGQKLYKTGEATDVGAFFSDQAWLTPWFSIKAGFRWDHWNSHYSATDGVGTTNTYLGQQQNTFNPNVSLMYTPTDDAMLYFTWSESTTPLGLYVTNSSEPLTSTTSKMHPERSNLYEVGGKYNAFHGRMGFTLSAFRLEKSNAILGSDGDSSVVASSDRQRNQGIEMSVSGEIMKNWQVIGTYAYYDATTTWSATPSNVGNRVIYVPKNSATLWSTYTVAPGSAWNLTFGGGLTWRQSVWLNAANTARVPANFDWSAVISHSFLNNHWRVAMNGYNLANRLNYTSLFSDRAVPAPGRSFLFALSTHY
ncbi:TonB-dependent receptor [Acetobacter conturbans]|uniref:TonB-dependent receptor n=1 Tax=Acetobacter conturbans TaxID=1737472 RepID=A0ABX0K545_9PROT|nr:TonB-dependent receptor [Acetobacter conturbans]NHN88554.1 TonB-dependent receptor [Acetobacter conturbans]